MVTQYGQADISWEVSGCWDERRSVLAASFPRDVCLSVSYCVTRNYSFYPVHTYKMLKEKWLRWWCSEMRKPVIWRGGIYTYSYDVICPASWHHRSCEAPGPKAQAFVQYPKSCTRLINSQNTNMDLFHIKKPYQNHPYTCRLTPCFRRHFALSGIPLRSVCVAPLFKWILRISHSMQWASVMS